VRSPEALLVPGSGLIMTFAFAALIAGFAFIAALIVIGRAFDERD
jgi:hypothetical protein